MSKIQLLVPTRNRPSNMERLWLSAHSLANQKDLLSITFYIDDDDYGSLAKVESLNLPYKFGPRITMSSMYKEIYDGVSDIVWVGGDDVVFESNGWDDMVRNGFIWPDKIGLVYGSDGYMDAKLATHAFISREWINAIGYITYPAYSADWADSHNFEIASNIGRANYLPDLSTQHYHYATGRSQPDQTMIEKNMRGAQDNMAQVFISLLPQRIADANKLCDKIGKLHVSNYKVMFP